VTAYKQDFFGKLKVGDNLKLASPGYKFAIKPQ
jgi:hypothetical protein